MQLPPDDEVRTPSAEKYTGVIVSTDIIDNDELMSAETRPVSVVVMYVDAAIS